MDISRRVHDFVSGGRELFRHLRTEGQDLSGIDLHILYIQLYILLIETSSLRQRLNRVFQDSGIRLWSDQIEKEHRPLVNEMVAQLKVGYRIRSLDDHFPARAGATGQIVSFNGMPGDWCVVVEWDNPRDNFIDEEVSTILPIDLKHFEVVPVLTDGP
ncbi:MAG TPA: hypothetical protein VH681_15630 [Nitrospiraceae bacterium]|jgi:hypothetical protein